MGKLWITACSDQKPLKEASGDEASARKTVPFQVHLNAELGAVGFVRWAMGTVLQRVG